MTWQKGQSGNLKGRKKKEDCLLNCIESELATLSNNGRTKEQNIAAALVQMADFGNLKAIELLLSYTVPKPQAKVELTGKDGGAVTIKIVEDGNG